MAHDNPHNEVLEVDDYTLKIAPRHDGAGQAVRHVTIKAAAGPITELNLAFYDDPSRFSGRKLGTRIVAELSMRDFQDIFDVLRHFNRVKVHCRTQSNSLLDLMFEAEA